MHHDLFDLYYSKELHQRLHNQARRITRGEMDLVDDLVQEALWKLSELDPQRIPRNAPAYVWRTLLDYMITVYRQERRARLVIPRQTPKSKRRRSSPRHMAAHRRRRHTDAGPQHDEGAPDDGDEYIALWEVP